MKEKDAWATKREASNKTKSRLERIDLEMHLKLLESELKTHTFN